jgi:hypothetical protein
MLTNFERNEFRKLDYGDRATLMNGVFYPVRRALIVTSTVGVQDDSVVHVMPVVQMDIVVHRINLVAAHGNNQIQLKKLA